MGNKPMCQKYFGYLFSNYNFDWDSTHILPQLITVDSS